MTADRFTLVGADRRGFAEALDAQFGVGVLADGEIDFLVHVLEARSGGGDKIASSADERSGAGFHLRVGDTYLHIDVQRALLVTAIALLDFFKTQGLASVLWGASGRDLRCFARLAPEDGSFCNFLSVQSKAGPEPLTAAAIAGLTAGLSCRHTQIGCRHLNDGACRITAEAVEANLQTLAAQRAIECDANGRAVRTR